MNGFINQNKRLCHCKSLYGWLHKLGNNIIFTGNSPCCRLNDPAFMQSGAYLGEHPSTYPGAHHFRCYPFETGFCKRQYVLIQLNRTPYILILYVYSIEPKPHINMHSTLFDATHLLLLFCNRPHSLIDCDCHLVADASTYTQRGRPTILRVSMEISSHLFPREVSMLKRHAQAKYISVAFMYMYSTN